MNRIIILLVLLTMLACFNSQAQISNPKNKSKDLGTLGPIGNKSGKGKGTRGYGASMRINRSSKVSKGYSEFFRMQGVRIFHICIANNQYGHIQFPDFVNAYPNNKAPGTFIRGGNLVLPTLSGTINDATSLSEKIKHDYLYKKYEIGQNNNAAIDSTLENHVFTYNLFNRDANLKNIKSTFKKVIDQARPNDKFIFSFSGIGFAIDNNETILIPYMPVGHSIDDFNRSMLTVSQLCAWIKQIPCKQQLIVSDACHAAQLALPVMKNLFDTERIINEQRNLALLSAKGVAYERRLGKGGKIRGELSYSLLQVENILMSMHMNNYDGMFAEIKTAERQSRNSTQAKIYTEKDFRTYQKVIGSGPGMRGSIPEETAQQLKPTELSKTYALVVSSNQYKKGNGWKNLKNPANDADEIAGILKERYNTEVIRVKNPKDKIYMLDMIDSVKKLVDTNDKLIVFFAGHGGYHKDDMTGYIVLKESQALAVDKHLQSYLTFSDIRNKLGLSKARNVMVVLDVCFGGNFDSESQTVSMATYRDSELTTSELIKRMNKQRSRIFLAAGEYAVPDFWKNGDKHSPFAKKLIKALNTEKDFTCPGRMYEFLKGNITKPILKPFYGHKADGDFLVAVEKD